MKNKATNPTATILVITTGFIVVHMVTHQQWALWVSLIVGTTGIFSTYLSKKIDLLWMKLTYVLSLIMPNILLSIVYYIFLFPIAVLSRLFKKNDTLKLSKPVTTFVTVNRDFDKKSFENPW